MTEKTTTAKKTTKAPTKKTTRKPTKKAIAAAEKKVLSKVHKDEDGSPCLTELQLLYWKTSMAESELAKMTWQGSEKDIELLLRSIPAYKELRSKTDGLKNAFAKKSRDYMTLLSTLSSRLGFDLTMCIINDNTGKITFVDKDGKVTGDVPLFGHQK